MHGDRSADLFDSLFAPDELLDATSGSAWVRGMLDAEAALAAASAHAGIVPASAAEAIGRACAAARLEPGALGRSGRESGNPVVPLVVELRRLVPEDAAEWVHWGATSQDILDTAAMLVATRAGRHVVVGLDRLAEAGAALAETHRATIMTARTLLQPALPTTFGAKAAGWLVGTLQAREDLVACLARLPVSLGGAAGTLATFGPAGPAVVAEMAEKLGLVAPLVPWHTVADE